MVARKPLSQTLTYISQGSLTTRCCGAGILTRLYFKSIAESEARYTLPVSTGRVHGGLWTRVVCTELKGERILKIGLHF